MFNRVGFNHRSGPPKSNLIKEIKHGYLNQIHSYMLEDDLKLQSKFDAFYHHPALNGISYPLRGVWQEPLTCLGWDKINMSLFQ